VVLAAAVLAAAELAVIGNSICFMTINLFEFDSF